MSEPKIETVKVSAQVHPDVYVTIVKASKEAPHRGRTSDFVFAAIMEKLEREGRMLINESGPLKTLHPTHPDSRL